VCDHGLAACVVDLGHAGDFGLSVILVVDQEQLFGSAHSAPGGGGEGDTVCPHACGLGLSVILVMRVVQGACIRSEGQSKHYAGS
jgi:hypothetical protein